MLSLALLAIAAYAATNIDSLFVLLAFLSEAQAQGNRSSVITGQFVGSLTLIAISTLLAALLTHLPAGYVGLLGVLPIGVGLAKAWERFKPSHPNEGTSQPDATQNIISAQKPVQTSSWLTVAGVALANGSDNLAVYVPLYAGHSRSEGALISGVFLAMIALWCAASVWLVGHPLLGAPIRRYGTALLPFILIVIGLSVIVENHTPRIVFGL